MKYLLGTKQYMTQIFDEKGVVHVGTVLETSPLSITQVKTKEKDGYEAIQVGFGAIKEKNLSKAVKGHLKGKNLRTIKEYRYEGATGTVGDSIDSSIFQPGDKVEVLATSKGKGFQGGVKRHGFKGGSRSHGQKHSEREPGSIGGSGGRAGGRVAKGIKMAGRMGGDRVTVKNLKVLAVDPEKGTIIISGAIPGRRGTVVEIKSI